MLEQLLWGMCILSFFSRTLTAVHDSILDDLVYPSEIVGKRIRIKLDGSRLTKVYGSFKSSLCSPFIIWDTCLAKEVSLL